MEALLVAQLINNGHHVDFYMMGPSIPPMTKEFNDGSRKVKTTRYKSVETMRARYAGLKKAGYTPLPR